MLPNKNNQKQTVKQILSIINRICNDELVIITDEFKEYKPLKQRKYLNLVIDLQRAYSNNILYPHGIESIWTLPKRGKCEIYHYFIAQYLQYYINECVF